MDDGFKKGYLMSNHSGGRSSSSSSSMNNGDEEFEEADVWEAAHDHGHDPRSSSSFMMKKSKSSNSFANSSSTKKKAPRSSHESSSSTSSMGAHHHHHHHHHGGQPRSSSGPLLAPGWPHNSAGLSHRSSPKPDFCSGYQEQQDEDEEEMIPPHEFIARRLARTQISSSVCEGAGRTLKGRDLSRVRNAILTKTGFLEQ